METKLRQLRREAKMLNDQMARQNKENDLILRELRHAETRQGAMQETYDREKAQRDALAAQLAVKRKEGQDLGLALDKV